MLVEFSVGNFASIKEKVTLSMKAATIKEYAENNVFLYEGESYLKSAAIYGANASGKSNVLKALAFFKWFIINSSKESQANEKIPVQPFLLSTDTETAPSFFELVFYIKETNYRYGILLNQDKVLEEWLFTSSQNRKEKPLFIRTEEGIDCQKSFKEGGNLEDKTRDNALFLWVVAQFNGKISTEILNWFKEVDVIYGFDNDEYEARTRGLFKDKNYNKRIASFVKLADFGINGLLEAEQEYINLDELPSFSYNVPDLEYQEPVEISPEWLYNLFAPEKFSFGEGYGDYIQVLHDKYDNKGNKVSIVKLGLNTQESSGTQKYFSIAGPIIEALAKGSVIIIDELDAKLHPILTRAIVRLFNSKEGNPNNAQLIFTTHDTNLLNAKILRRDQIWFTEKDRFGATDLYSLVEYKMDNDEKVRKDASFEKEYIQGRYGAIPFLGDFNSLMASKDGAENKS